MRTSALLANQADRWQSGPDARGESAPGHPLTGTTLQAHSSLGAAFGELISPAGLAGRRQPSRRSEMSEMGTASSRAPALDSSIRYADIVRKLIEVGEVDSARRVLAVAQQAEAVDPECRRLARFLEPPTARAHPARGSSSDPELDWISAHGHEYRGCWVAVLGDDLLASAGTLRELLRVVRAAAPTRPPLIHAIPPAS